MKRLATGVVVSAAVVHFAVYGSVVVAAYWARTWSEWLSDTADALEGTAAVCAPYDVEHGEAA